MSVSPNGRLSEEVLAHSIEGFYTQSSLIPAGIAIEALAPWSAKMACGLRKCVEKFRKIYRETPGKSKSEKLTALKLRLKNAKCEPSPDAHTGVELEEDDLNELVQPHCDQPQCDKLELALPPPTAKPDLAALALKMKKHREALAAAARPVATPARSNYQLLDFVVTSLANQAADPPEPFATKSGEDGQLAEAQAGEAKTKKAPKRKAKKNKSGRKKSVVAGPEEEAALALPSGISAGAVAEGPRVESSGSSDQALGTEGATYQPRVFSKARLAYIAEKRKDGATFKQASGMWMASNERATYLATLSPSQLKKRRFL